ncbi:MAG: hypothetical protein ABR947_10240 [Solirubrobacteraceae bacterium]|jgi:hypothetical protein
MRQRTAFAALIGALVAAAAVASPAPGQAAATGRCRTLSAGQIPFAALETAYRKLTGLPPATKLSRTQPQRYGVCGTTHYAFALLIVAQGVKLSYREQVAQQDHSPIWVQRPGGEWVDEGIDSLCRLAPPALINLWKVGAKCG